MRGSFTGQSSKVTSSATTDSRGVRALHCVVSPKHASVAFSGGTHGRQAATCV